MTTLQRTDELPYGTWHGWQVDSYDDAVKLAGNNKAFYFESKILSCKYVFVKEAE